MSGRLRVRGPRPGQTACRGAVSRGASPNPAAGSQVREGSRPKGDTASCHFYFLCVAHRFRRKRIAQFQGLHSKVQ